MLFHQLSYAMKRSQVYAIVALVVVVAIVAGVVVTQFTAQPAGPEVVKIGALEPLSGVFVSWGNKHLNGMKYAVEELNKRGGILGKPVELVVFDTKGDPKEAVTIFRKMVEEEGVIAVAGPVSSSVGLAAAKEAESLRVPLFLHMAGSHRILTKESRFTFRTCLPAAPMNIEGIANFIKQEGYKRIGAIIADYEWGHSIRQAIEQYIVPIEGVQVQIEVAPLRTDDFTPYLRKLQDLNPEFLINTGHPPGNMKIPKQAIELGFQLKGFIGSGTPPEAILKGLGDVAFQGAMDYACADYSSNAYKELAEKYYKDTGDFMEAHALTGYVTVMMIADAIEKSQSFDPAVIADTIRNGRFVHPAYAWPLSYTEWGELKEATPVYVTYKPGPPPGGINPDADWRIEVLFKSPPLTPYVPE